MSISPRVGYSKKFKKYQASTICKEPDQLTPKGKVKLEPLSPLRFRINNSDSVFFDSVNKIIISKSPLTRVIEDKSKDYESALLTHLRLQTYSRESEKDDFSPLTKIHTNSPTRFQGYHDHSIENSLQNVEIKEKMISSEIKILDGRSQKNKIRAKNLSEIPNFDLSEQKLSKLKNSIEDMRVLLKKLKNK